MTECNIVSILGFVLLLVIGLISIASLCMLSLLAWIDSQGRDTEETDKKM